ncbi:WXG100 family type VII secretion target [Rhodococcoides corynebacterioides]|uniref:ESAT-6-like protein n=2 Tax=Mycobacteriales TaxID=85007 RepID=A0ABS7NRR8_9NOCA|nr:WXG100 family type VII secretion target [Rhodococcus corynebacterioides]AMY19624.1 ESAT-6-like protein EsxB [Rhodococcus sp. PBTS 1]MBY6312259.1 WXG100 family type VII secretion target [Rhodococcus kroppenstedtii]MBY6319657.1 WXG100 family type VII secretion target [Rhodococcus kroppenstedtii]MBY6350717.1 WXG100 family type VII secretion target [Rhodococcus corynebacterioides]MBY6363134.1 WXG100 family type VII secretion target [Rhodococcus corynebacterioides]
MSQMRTTVETMQVTAGKVDQLTLEVKALLDQLRGDVASVGGSWEGAAAVAFQSVMNSWDTSANKLQVALGAIGDSIKASGTAYAAAEDDNTRAVSVAGSLNL